MKITKLEHSGLAVAKNNQTLLIDPVEFSLKLPEFENVVAIIITHMHDDHYQPEVVSRLQAAFPSVRIYAPGDVSSQILEAKQVRNGSIAQAGDFNLVFFSENHSPVFKGEIPCQNVGVMVDGTLAHPGDSFDLPQQSVEVLCVPVAGPWCKISDAAEYIEASQPKNVLAIHDAVLSPLGRGYATNCLKKVCSDNKINFFDLKPGESIEG